MKWTPEMIQKEIKRKASLGIKTSDPNNMEAWKKQREQNKANNVFQASVAVPRPNSSGSIGQRGNSNGKWSDSLDKDYDASNPYHRYKREYTQSQSNRYEQAKTSGDTDLMGRLEKDSNRLGYALKKPEQKVFIPKPLGTKSATTTSSNFKPPETKSYPVYSPEEIKEQARAEMQQRILERQRTAQQAKQGINTAYDRSEALEQDNRNLQNNQFDRVNNPYSGGTDYRKAMLERERGITDRQQDQDLASRLANIDIRLQDYINASPDQRQAIERELMKDERAYSLSLNNQQFNQARDTFGINRDVYESDRAWNGLSASQQAQLGIQEGQLTGNYQGQQTLAAQNQYFNQDMATQQFDANETQRQWDNQFREGQFDFQKAQQLWNNNFQNKSFEQGIRQFSQQLGLDYTRMSQQQQRFVAEMAYKNEAMEYGKQQDAIRNDQWQQEFGARQNQQDPMGPGDYKTNQEFATDYSYVVNNPEEAKNKLKNNAESFIQTYGFDGYKALLAGLPDADENEILKYLED
jgi:hypothetical protein